MECFHSQEFAGVTQTYSRSTKLLNIRLLDFDIGSEHFASEPDWQNTFSPHVSSCKLYPIYRNFLQLIEDGKMKVDGEILQQGHG